MSQSQALWKSRSEALTACFPLLFLSRNLLSPPASILFSPEAPPQSWSKPPLCLTWTFLGPSFLVLAYVVCCPLFLVATSTAHCLIPQAVCLTLWYNLNVPPVHKVLPLPLDLLWFALPQTPTSQPHGFSFGFLNMLHAHFYLRAFVQDILLAGDALLLFCCVPGCVLPFCINVTVPREFCLDH